MNFMDVHGDLAISNLYSEFLDTTWTVSEWFICSTIHIPEHLLIDAEWYDFDSSSPLKNAGTISYVMQTKNLHSSQSNA